MTETITIAGVDADLLDEQRQIIASIDRAKLSPRQGDALDGIQHMLNFWSDKRHWLKESEQ